MMTHVELMTLIAKLNLKLCCQNQVYVITVIDAYILVSGTIAVAEVAAVGGNNNIQVVFKNCA